MKNILIIILIVPIALQSATLKGKVSDLETHQLLPLAKLILVGTNFNSETKVTGYFEIDSIPIGQFIIHTSYVGFKTKIDTIVISAIDEVKELDISLSAMPAMSLNTWQPASKSISQGPHFTIFDSSWAERMAIPCSRKALQIQGAWNPSQKNIQSLENCIDTLSHIIGKSKYFGGGFYTLNDHNAQGVVHKANDFYRQYVGVIIDGIKYIYINAFPPIDAFDSKGNAIWLEQPVKVCDGGANYWGVLYDPETRLFSKFEFSSSL